MPLFGKKIVQWEQKTQLNISQKAPIVLQASFLEKNKTLLVCLEQVLEQVLVDSALVFYSPGAFRATPNLSAKQEVDSSLPRGRGS